MYARQVLAIVRARHNGDHYEVAFALNNLASLLGKLVRFILNKNWNINIHDLNILKT